MSIANSIISKVWSFYNTLHDDGVGSCLNQDDLDFRIPPHPENPEILKMLILTSSYKSSHPENSDSDNCSL